MNEITTKSTGLPALHADRATSDMINRYSTALREISFRKWVIPAEQAPSGDDRRMLETRHAELDRLIAPGDSRLIKAALLSLFLGYPSLQRQSQEQSELMLRKYEQELHGAPPWAVRKVCEDYSGGRRGKPEFPPTAPEIAKAVDDMLRQPREEFWSIRKILTATVEMPLPSDAERAASAARVQGLVDGLKTSMVAEKEVSAARREQALAWSKVNNGSFHDQEWAQLGVYDPPKISVALAKSLGTLNQYLPKNEEEAA